MKAKCMLSLKNKIFMLMLGEYKKVKKITNQIVDCKIADVEPVGSKSNKCFSYKINAKDRQYKLFQVDSKEQAESISLTIGLLQSHGINIPNCYGVYENYVLTDWIHGKRVELNNEQHLKKMAQYHALLHSVEVPAEAKTSKFYHLGWLLERFKNGCGNYIASEKLDLLKNTILGLVPGNLDCAVTNADFIPSNLIIADDGNFFLVDNEFLYISTGYEYDLYNLSIGLGESLSGRYFEIYSKFHPLDSYYQNLDFWKLCFGFKKCRKYFENKDLKNGSSSLNELEQGINEYLDKRSN